MRVVIEDIEIKKLSEPISENYGKNKGLFTYFRNIFRTKDKYLMNQRSKKSKKLIAGFLAAVVVLMQNPYSIVLAQTAPTPPSAPSEPTAPTEPEPSTAPSEPTAPTPPSAPETPTLEEAVNPTPIPVESTPTDVSDESSSSDSDGSGGEESTSGQVDTTSSATTEGSGGQNNDGAVGSVTLATGDADNVGNISTIGNTNISVVPEGSGGGTGATVVNGGNGANSTNSGSVSLEDTTNTLQDNSANIGNNLYQESVTGENSASKNTGGDVTVKTGDANTTGTILTAVNTNLDGVAVYEFNVSDTYFGDYLLDFSDANCISGCGGGNTEAANIGNGADSTNTSIIDATSHDNTFQTNDAIIQNNMLLESVSGDNDADKNTGGNTLVETGDANVSGSVVNMVNNNIEGGVVYAVVNIFGDLVGDIILPDGTVLSCCTTSAEATNSGNGADSINTASVDQTNTDSTYQFNNASIQNNLALEAETGDNSVSKNTDGASSVTSGDANIVAQVLNVANTNIVGGNWWLVIVNEAGKWIGKIIGSPDGQNYAGSPELEITVDENGQVLASNSGNGSGSTNDSEVSQTSNTTTVQNNNATIVNNVGLSAVSGGNSADKNTGGSSSVVTGDANVIASIVNFVNNNIVGSGKLIVTVVNIFGSWLGDFVGPGQTKEADSSGNSNNQALGGVEDPESGQDVSSSDSNQEDDNQDTTIGVAQSGRVSTVLAAVGSSGNSISEEEVDEEESIADAGLTQPLKTAAKKSVKINLAWLTLLIPLGIIFYLRRSKSLRLNKGAVSAHRGRNA